MNDFVVTDERHYVCYDKDPKYVLARSVNENGRGNLERTRYFRRGSEYTTYHRLTLEAFTVTGNPGSGCSGNLYQLFNTGAFAPPAVGSVGLSSPQYPYVRGCWFQDLDLSLQRQFRIKERVSLSVRLDAFNAMNQDHITGRNGTMQVTSPTNATIVNLPFTAPGGSLVSNRDQPKDAGFGMANAFQSPRTLQIWVRLTF